jgi:signal transduction histidine kinase
MHGRRWASRLGGELRRWGDALVVLLLGGIGTYEILVGPLDTWTYPGPASHHLPFLAVCVVPLLWRRRAPVAVLAVITVGSVGWVYTAFGGGQAPFHPFIAQLLAVYGVAAQTEGRQLWRGVAVAGVLLLADLPGIAMGRTLDTVLPSWALLGLAATVGRVVRDRVRLAEELRATAHALEREREARLVDAVSSERVRIARELHDVITHAMTGIVVQASVEGRAAAQRDPEAAAVLAGIERTGREVLVELRRLLGALRTTSGTSLAPQPSLRNVDVLLAPLRHAGITVSLDVRGELGDLPSGVDLSAYRIVQEALTNTLKHSGARTVDVTLRRENGHVDIDVVDDGRGPAAATATGHGLVGMRERARLCGGDLETGAVDGADGVGYRVRGRLPIDGRPA